MDKEFDIERSEYEEHVQDIKKRKRRLKILQDSVLIKKIKSDLIREKRSAKRSERSKLRAYLKEQVNKFSDEKL